MGTGRERSTAVGQGRQVERVSPNDLTTLETDRGPAPMNIGAVLVLEGGSSVGVDAVRSVLAARVPRVRRLRQRLVRTPPGCGRPVWVDDAAFDVDRHVEEIRLSTTSAPQGDGPPLGGLDGAVDDLEHPEVRPSPSNDLLDLAAAAVCTGLPRDRPLWSARWITGLPDGDAALVLVVHHCLADGLGGLAVLGALADDGVEPVDDTFPAAAPSVAALAREAWQSRLAAWRRLPTMLHRTVSGTRELMGGPHRARLAGRSSLNHPTGALRRLSTATVSLQGLLDAAHGRGCTVNDLVLCAASGALRSVLQARGDGLTELVVSVPISSRRGATADRLGNEVGVVPLVLPLIGDREERLRRIAALTAARRGPEPGTSAAPLGVAFRALARVGLFQAFIDRQRLVHTFVTNVRGPASELSFAGHRVVGIVPAAVSPGNVGASFDVLSYAGRLVVTVVADPLVVPEHSSIAAAVQSELSRLSA